ncbi:MAG: hypothetical protein CMM53_01195 [Rhodospirillaceae bacterium]|nr:hypothetical protein [Rhodospirillaceae bacterium]
MSTSDNSMSKRRLQTFSRWDRFKRACRLRLVVPLKRSVHSPTHIARGVGIGMFWAMTPTVGIQMIFCFITWVVARRIFNWDFHLLISLAWTWITNVLTLLPSYYLFFLTGQIILGRFDDLSGYNEFLISYDKNFAADGSVGYWEGVWLYVVLLFKGWGVPMLIGCGPWAVLGGWAGYAWSLKFINGYRSAKLRRNTHRIKKSEDIKETE